MAVTHLKRCKCRGGGRKERYIQEDDKKEIKRLCVGTVKHKVN